ncbi:MAG: thiamine-phosphate kinase [Actinomycetes bacterium]
MTSGDDLAATGEFGLIAALARRLPQGLGVLIGPGDDAAVVASSDGRVVVTVDLVVEGVLFRRDWAAPDEIGRRAAAASLADVAAMGARPTALVVGLAAPASTQTSWALRLVDGLRDEAALVGASVVGGDVTAGDQVVVSVTALGDLEGRAPVTRSGARAGDVVAVCGRLGWAAAGLAVLRRGFGSPRALVEAYRRPQPPYAAGLDAAVAGASAMCDVSDGLVADLGHVAVASGVVIDVDRAALEVGEPLSAVAAAYGVDPLEWVLTGGDDHALVATFPADAARPEGFAVIGRVRAVAPGTDEEPHVRVDDVPWSGPAGHGHFSG